MIFGKKYEKARQAELDGWRRINSAYKEYPLSSNCQHQVVWYRAGDSVVFRCLVCGYSEKVRVGEHIAKFITMARAATAEETDAIKSSDMELELSRTGREP